MGYEIQPYAPRGVTESEASPVGMGALPFELTIKNLFLVAAVGAVFVRFVLPSLQKKRKNPRRRRKNPLMRKGGFKIRHGKHSKADWAELRAYIRSIQKKRKLASKKRGAVGVKKNKR
ncbi:MAG: hypothetical protein ABH877_04375 [bacterium]